MKNVTTYARIVIFWHGTTRCDGMLTTALGNYVDVLTTTMIEAELTEAVNDEWAMLALVLDWEVGRTKKTEPSVSGLGQGQGPGLLVGGRASIGYSAGNPTLKLGSRVG